MTSPNYKTLRDVTESHGARWHHTACDEDRAKTTASTGREESKGADKRAGELSVLLLLYWLAVSSVLLLSGVVDAIVVVSALSRLLALEGWCQGWWCSFQGRFFFINDVRILYFPGCRCHKIQKKYSHTQCSHKKGVTISTVIKKKACCHTCHFQKFSHTKTTAVPPRSAMLARRRKQEQREQRASDGDSRTTR